MKDFILLGLASLFVFWMGFMVGAAIDDHLNTTKTKNIPLIEFKGADLQEIPEKQEVGKFLYEINLYYYEMGGKKKLSVSSRQNAQTKNTPPLDPEVYIKAAEDLTNMFSPPEV